MKETRINLSRTFVTNHQPSEILNPRVGAFNNPSLSVTTQRSTILMSSSSIIGSGWNDGINSTVAQVKPNLVAVVSPIRHESLWISPNTADTNCLQCWQQQFHLRRGRRVHVKSERSTLAINQYHKLRSLAAFCLAHFEPPFLAEANVPSTKHSSHRIISFSSSWPKKARQSFSRLPSLAHFCKRRWMVLDGPYRRGSSLQGDPVQSIHKIPSKQPRSSNEGRPPFRSFFRHGRFRSGSSALTFSHCRSVNFRHANFHSPPVGYDVTRHGHYLINHRDFSVEVSG